MTTLHPLATKFMQGLALASALLLLTPAAHAANFTWDGEGGDDGWGTPLNWVGNTAPGATGQTLFFAGTNRLTPDNATVTSLNGIIFTTNAGSFTLTGNSFTLGGNITNSSGVLQTIENDMTMNADRTVWTTDGNVTLNGVVGQSGGTRSLGKNGAGTLTLAGANTFTGAIFISRGTVVLDAGAGGEWAAGNANLYFNGQQTGAPSSAAQGGSFIVRGANSGTTTVNLDKQVYFRSLGGANSIIIDANGGSGTSLSFTNIARQSSGTMSTLNVDLSSSSGNRLYISNVGANSLYFGNVFTYMTVTDTVNTGFATRDAGTGEITRYTNTTSLPASYVYDQSANYHISGDQTRTGNGTVNTVTIQGAGTMDGNYLMARAFLMQPGSGDYTFSNTIGNTENLFIHQYSTDGDFIIDGNLQRIGTGARYIAKDGPGTVILNGNTVDYTGQTYIQGGEMRVNGSIAEGAGVYVFDTATLSGVGTIGAATNYTPVSILAGGTFDATPTGSDAMTIAGTLTLDAEATFKMNLAGTNLGAVMVTNSSGTIVTLDGDLLLTLGYTPTLGDEIDLLTWTNGTSSGTFASINGILGATNVSFGGGYNFDVHYEANRVWLENTAIPEPAAFGLLLAAGSMLLLRRRR